ncbi:G-protein coupled receptor Mth2-like [Zerene cesonia]|uniref:G-protein coupled receptor Mth2-like n=1 Tax=Zerene cesonia TaxID=33412 RepID=UPI0018E541B1|nr:G-protein coupled receptor Mth2-like [Zerene cesonia]
MLIYWCLMFFICLLVGQCYNSDIILENYEDPICQFKTCINKCCSRNQYMNTTIWYMTSCVDNNENFDLDMSDLQLYDTEDHSRTIDKKLGDVFLLKPNLFTRNETFAYLSARFDILKVISYLNEDGDLYLESPNAYIRWRKIDKADFCVDYGINNNVSQIQFWGLLEDEYQPPPYKTFYQSSGLIISSIFLFLLFLVYCALPELRNIGGMVLMAYVASLLGAYVSLAVLNLGRLSETDCIVITTFIYFFFLSAFSWMNVMSFDIWWTFRAHRTQKQRLMVYLKLSVIMGINWILEVISSFSPRLNIWLISDTYNLLIGVTIFLIFVCKRSIYNKLMIRFRVMRQYNLPKRSLTSSFTLESNLSQEAPPNVCANPKGERKRSLEQKPTFEI